MDKKEIQAWNECLALWKEISSIPDTPTTKGAESFKQDVLKRLGIGKRFNLVRSPPPSGGGSIEKDTKGWNHAINSEN